MKRKILLIPLFLGVLVAAGLAWLALRSPDDPNHLSASGTVEATDARLGFQATGRIAEIRVREGEVVEAGRLLARLDTAEMEARRQQAEAQVEAARARLLELERGFRSEEVEQARAALAAARERLGDAQRDFERTRRLWEGGAVSRESYDKATTLLDVAESQLTQAEEQLRLLERGPRPEQIEAQRAELAKARAALAATEAVLDNMTITAPFDGIITVRNREPGEIVAPGAPVLTLMDPDDRWVRIYVREDRIGAVALGSQAVIRSDTYPEKRYGGEVTFIASEAEFTPKNVQTQEERVRLVYAVKVRITNDPGYELKPGMPADVVVELTESGSG